MLCGLLPASSGFLQVAGVDLRHARAQARARIGYVSQKFALYGNLTVHGEPRVLRRRLRPARRATARAHADGAASSSSCGARSSPPSGQLPGGFKQRLAMATGLLHEPEILFLDEPTSGTDPLARREFWRRITALAEAGVTVIITTHFMEEAEYCDRIVIQDAGTVLAIGTPQEVRHAGARPRSRIDMEEAFIGIVEQARQRRASSRLPAWRRAMTAASASPPGRAHAQGNAPAAARPEQPRDRRPAADRADPDLRLRPVAGREERAAGGGAGGQLAHRDGRHRRPAALALHLARDAGFDARGRAADARAPGRRHRARARRLLAPAGRRRCAHPGAGARRRRRPRQHRAALRDGSAAAERAAPGRPRRQPARRHRPRDASSSACGSTPPTPAPGTWCRG